MKKLLAFLLAATMLCAMLVLPSAAADNVNYQQDIDYVKTAPKIDGVVKSKEYGSILPVHRYSESQSQFVTNEGHTKLTDWDFEFYAAWDKNNLYMAWVVESDVHAALPKKEFDTGGNPISDNFTNESLGYMWMHSCVQFIITPGAPGGDANYTDNYLEVGFCELEDHTTGRIAWKYPTTVSSDQIALDKWQAVVKRDDAKGTTTYEIAIPWKMSGIEEAGTDKQFGLTYAVAAQEHYENKDPGMIEWQNGVLGGKYPNNAAVITLKAEEEIILDTGVKKDGKIPSELAEYTHLVIDKVNKNIVGEDSVILTDIRNLTEKDFDIETDPETGEWISGYNLRYTHNWLLAPTEEKNIYEIVEVVPTVGDGTLPVFKTKFEKDMLIVAFHSDGQQGGAARAALAKSITEGSIVGLWEVDLRNGDTKYKNSSVYVIEAADPNAPFEGGFSEDVKLHSATDADLVLDAETANLDELFVLVFDKDGRLVKVGEKLATTTVPAGGNAITFTEDNDDLKEIYDNASTLFASTTAGENGEILIDANLGCPYELTLNTAEDGTVTYSISKVASIIDNGGDEQGSTDNGNNNTNNNTSKPDKEDESSEPVDEEEEEKNLTWLWIVLGVVGGLAVVAVIVVVIIVLLKKKKGAKAE